MLADKAVGIDLGTTNSVAAFLDLTDRAMTFGVFGGGDRPDAILPSVVAWVPERGGVVVGKEAKARRGLTPAPILSVKRSMGTPVTVELGGKQVTPTHVSSLILKELAAGVRRAVGRDKHELDIRRAVITVPAHFGQEQSEDTTKAGEEAGLEVVELLREPVAAVIHYCWVRSRDRAVRGEPPAPGEETFLVYDIGGGTFDVTVIKKIPNPTTGDDFQILAVDGDSFLGGDDFDGLLARHLLTGLAAKPGVRIGSTNPGDKSNAVRFAQLSALAEELKRELSDNETATYDRRDYVTDDDGRPVTVAGSVTRDEFERLVKHLAAGSIEKSQAAMEMARLRPDQLDSVLMVGGSSRVPMLKRLLTETLCKPGAGARNGAPVVHSPDLCVGAGAALKAAALGKVYRPPSGTTVVLRGYGASARPTAAWTVEVRPPAEPLTGGRAVLAARTGGAVAGEILSPTRAVFPEIPVPPDQTTVYTVSVKTAGGKELAGFDAPLRHDKLFVEPIGLNTSANVLSFRLTLAVRDAARGQLVEEELARKLTALPNQFTHRFKFPGGGAAIRFPIHADGVLVRTVVVPVPPGVPAGARVILKVALDANQKIRCGGEIPDAPGQKTFEFTVEPPPPEAIPTRAEFEELEAKAQTVLRLYRGDDKPTRAVRLAKLCGDIRRALDQNDPAKVVQRVRELKVLLDEMDPARFRVEPPVEELDKMVGQCHAAARELTGSTTLRVDEILDDVDRNAELARVAADAVPPDQDVYSRGFKNVERHRDALFEEYQRRQPPKQEGPLERARREVQEANERYQGIRESGDTFSAGDEGTLQKARAAIDRAEALLDRRDAEGAAGEVNQAHLLLGGVSGKKKAAPKPPPGQEGDGVYLETDNDGPPGGKR